MQHYFIQLLWIHQGVNHWLVLCSKKNKLFTSEQVAIIANVSVFLIGVGPQRLGLLLRTFYIPPEDE